MRRLGIGYRSALDEWILSRPPEIGCVEITAEHFFDQGESTLAEEKGRSLDEPAPKPATPDPITAIFTYALSSIDASSSRLFFMTSQAARATRTSTASPSRSR